jgi:hypothetical protein
MKVDDLGDATLHGWKEKVADTAARKAPVRTEYVRAVVGLVFLALSVRHVVRSAREFARRARS